jgi:aminocarboxymuconate-semialdehyde decarboxylase
MAGQGKATGLHSGSLDVHAHLLPRSCYRIPVGEGFVDIIARDDELHLGAVPMAVTEQELSSVPQMIANMDLRGIGVRVVSAPPYAFAVDGTVDAAADYSRRLNDALLAMVASYRDRLIPFGVLPVQNVSATAEEAQRLAELGVPGVAVPPVVGDLALGQPGLQHVLAAADAAELAVLVHPMQRRLPGLAEHYLENLIGNPVETACGIASIILNGLFESMPSLRIAFAHGAGVAPVLLGRWDHGFQVRKDVARDTGQSPSEVYRTHVYADSVIHSTAAATLLRAVTDSKHILLGSDYPFDMGEPEPVRTAQVHQLDTVALRQNALRWLGVQGGN